MVASHMNAGGLGSYPQSLLVRSDETPSFGVTRNMLVRSDETPSFGVTRNTRVVVSRGYAKGWGGTTDSTPTASGGSPSDSASQLRSPSPRSW